MCTFILLMTSKFLACVPDQDYRCFYPSFLGHDCIPSKTKVELSPVRKKIQC